MDRPGTVRGSSKGDRSEGRFGFEPESTFRTIGRLERGTVRVEHEKDAEGTDWLDFGEETHLIDRKGRWWFLCPHHNGGVVGILGLVTRQERRQCM